MMAGVTRFMLLSLCLLFVACGTDPRVAELEGQLAERDALIAELRSELQGYRRTSGTDEQALPPAETTAAPRAQATVAGVRSTTGGRQDLVMLALNEGASAVIGDQFLIHRGERFIVTVAVEKVADDLLACRVLPGSWNTDGLEVERGDTAMLRGPNTGKSSGKSSAPVAP